MATIVELAGRLYDAFERKTRDNGDVFFVLQDEAPDWMEEVIRECHGDMLPDDFRYSMVRRLAGDIHDTGAEDVSDIWDARGEIVDSAVEIYTSRLIAWLGSHGARVCYCDDAAAEFGVAEDEGIAKRIQLGQYAEIGEIFGLLVNALSEIADEEDEEDEEQG